MEDLKKWKKREISQQLSVLKSQPLSQSGCAKIIETLKMKLEIFKAKKNVIACEKFSDEKLRATAEIFNDAIIRSIEKEIIIYLEILKVLEKNDVEICRL